MQKTDAPAVAGYYRTQKWMQCSQTTRISVEIHYRLYMKTNVTIPSKFTILSGEQAKNKQTKIMASIDDEEHKCI